MLRIIASQYLEHRFAVIGLGIIILLMLLAIFAPVIGNILGVDPNTQSIFNRYKPMMTTLERSLGEREEAVERFMARNKQHKDAIITTLKNAGLAANAADEDVVFEVMELAEVERIRDEYGARKKDGTFKSWATEFDVMARKTVLLRLAGWAGTDDAIGLATSLHYGERSEQSAPAMTRDPKIAAIHERAALEHKR
jgi:hypothetical protein